MVSIALPCPWGIFPALEKGMCDALHKQFQRSSFGQAAKWVEECVRTHQGTCLGISEPSLPTRVLNIGSKPSDIRLEVSNGSIGRYTCLSHCWGGAQPLKTTKDNFEDHLVSIPWDTIPKTFQEAIKFNWHLGIRYVWIDSLCIIQGDGDDWARESTKMCDVYGNGYLTIAASSAPDSTQGLFLQETWDLLSLRISGTGTQNTGIFGHRAFPDHPRMETAPDIEENEHWPLFERGWVLQERLMSPRVVHFFKHEVAWECGQRTLCRCGGINPTKKSDYHQALTQSDMSALAVQWQQLVQVYSCLHLSFQSDKLPALSGLAKQMAAKRPGARYLAGLWSDSLETDLLWTRWSLRGRRSETDRLPMVVRVPSWSWAKLKVRVDFPDENARTSKWVFFTILDISTTPETVDPTGKVLGGTLKISGPMFNASVVCRPMSVGEMAQDLPPDAVELGLIILTSKRPVWEVSEDPWNEEFLIFDNGMEPLGYSRGVVQPVDAVKILLMARTRNWNSGYKIPTGYRDLTQVEEIEYALILQQCGSSKTYRRIGMVVQKRIMRVETANYAGGDVGIWEKQPSVF